MLLLCHRRLRVSTNYVFTFKRFVLNTSASQINDDKQDENKNKLVDSLKPYENSIYHSDYLLTKSLRFGYLKNKIIVEKQTKWVKANLESLRTIQPLPLSLKFTSALNKKAIEEQEQVNKDKTDDGKVIINENENTHLPFAQYEQINSNISVELNKTEINDEKEKEDIADLSEIEVRQRLKQINKEDVNKWMEDYDSYEMENVDCVNSVSDNWSINYGTPDPHSNVSNVPCGGCGALLHCKDTSLPGYIPSEIFNNCDLPGTSSLSAVLCQRCYFLKKHNLALQVRVSPQDYPKVLSTIKDRKRSLVILVVDLLDFPCSIWPGMPDLFKQDQPMVVVGNKVDLLPQDTPDYLKRIENVLINNLKLFGFASKDIRHVALISAKTGYGIEELITKLFNIWFYKGDVYLVGTTNVGKSSLFNALLQSDYCKIQAGDLIQRATTSMWPGTTLNLLKFPITRPKGWNTELRNKRLEAQRKINSAEEELRKSILKTKGESKYATLIGHIGRTLSPHNNNVVKSDQFTLQHMKNDSGLTQMGIDENDKEFVMNKWCYDTPGVIQPDQITDLLTTDELVKTLPKELIRPRTFSVRKKSSIFIGGLARLDIIDGPISTRITIFSSNDLPITICDLKQADELYNKFLGTDLLAVPLGGEKRLKLWPGLKSKQEFTITGLHSELSCCDIVLSSAGWIAITPPRDVKCTVKPWTPNARGIYMRESLLPRAVSLRGKRMRFTPAYSKSKFYREDCFRKIIT